MFDEIDKLLKKTGKMIFVIGIICICVGIIGLINYLINKSKIIKTTDE